ncbi:MAG: HAD family hydrolase [Alphaproteobacteria bacterium]
MTDFNDIKAVITDLDDTLIPFAYSYSHYVNTLVTGIAKAAGMSESEVAKGFNELYLQKGIFQFEDVLNLHKGLANKFPYEDLTKKFEKEIAAAKTVLKNTCKPEKETLETLQGLKKQGKKLVLFTAGPASFTVDKLKAAGLEGLFDTIYAVKDNRDGGQQEAEAKHPSSEWAKIKLLERFPKSSADTYSKIVDDLKIAPKEAVMMGDNIYQDIYFAKKAGLNTVLVEGHKKQDKPHAMLGTVLAKHQINKIKILIQKIRLSSFFNGKGRFADAVVDYPSGLKKYFTQTTAWLGLTKRMKDTGKSF